MSRFTDQVVIITGGGSGIGQATARGFAAENARVVIADIHAANGEATAAAIRADGGQVLAMQTDVSSAESVAAMVAETVAQFGAADVLVNNAATADGNDILQVDEETWDRNLAVVLKSVYLCCRQVLPAMIERQRGAIINIASVNALGAYSVMPYSAAKAGVVNLTQNMAARYGRHGVRVNAVCPGTVRTPIMDPLLEKDPEFLERAAQFYPCGRIGGPKDIAGPVLFLASQDADWITGHALVVDGGLSCGNYEFVKSAEGAMD
jgi:meso-butanediol dehydrogenase / (S,S)-butanediol dehydrogenase / diacetyl reductase